MRQYFRLLLMTASTAIVFYTMPVALTQNSPTPPTSLVPSVSTPNSLNPDPNPLLRPTKPSEVQTQATYPITFQQALELALRHNPQLQIERQALIRSQASLRERKAALYPTLSLQSDFTRQETYDLSTDDSSNSTELDQLGISSSTDSSSASSPLSGDVQLSYNIYTGGERAANIRAAEQQLRSDQLDVERITEQTRLDVANDYYDLQNADEQVRINRSAVINSQQSLQDTQARERAGTGTRFEVLQAQVQLAQSVQSLTSALSSQRSARRQLAQRLNVSQTIDLSAADLVAITGTWTPTLEESIMLAYKNRIELEQFLLQRGIAEQNRRAALAAVRPQVSLSASSGLSNDFERDSSLAANYSVGAQLRWNFFDGGAARARALQSESDIKTAELNFADTHNSIRFNVEQAYFNLRSNFENIETTTLALHQSQAALRLARLRFQAGVGTQTDVVNEENNLTQAEGNRITAIVNYNKALASLQRNVGRTGQL